MTNRLDPTITCVTPGKERMPLQACNPCYPDEVRGGTQCNPCNPCYPDQMRGGSQCNPCNPCYPDQMRGGSQCNPCNPCYPDQVRGGSQCNPCNPCYPDQMQGGNSGSGGGCFLSSACAESLGLPDDCDELQTLRKFRDRRKETDPDFAELVKEYYEIAPSIVEKINAEGKANSVYFKLYEQLVLPCVKLIKEGNEEDAIILYTKIVRELQEQYK